AAPPDQPPTTESNGGSMDQNQAGAMSGSTGQPRTLGTMPENNYNPKKQQPNPNTPPAAAAAAAGQTGSAGTAPENPDQTATNNQPYALPGANADEQYQYAFDLMRQT